MIVRASLSALGSLAGHERIEPAEDHLARRGLQRAGNAEHDFPADLVAAAFHDDHGPVVEIPDSLVRLFPRLDDLNLHGLSRQDDDFERTGQIVDIDDVHASHLSHLGEVVVSRDQPAVVGLRE